MGMGEQRCRVAAMLKIRFHPNVGEIALNFHKQALQVVHDSRTVTSVSDILLFSSVRPEFITLYSSFPIHVSTIRFG